MFIGAGVVITSNAVRRSGMSQIETQWLVFLAPPNGACDYCISVYKYLTPSGVKKMDDH